jgi:hypothetical protein
LPLGAGVRTIPDMKQGVPARAILLVVAMVLAGCVSNKINWTARVGSYTLDQAIVELGPPDRQARLSDGAVVAEWLARRGQTMAYTTGPGNYGYPYWPGYYYGGFYPTYVVSSPDYFLRLTFDPEGKLSDWKKVRR